MRIKELAPQIFAEFHMYYDQILEAKNWSQVAVLHYAQEVSNGDRKWERYLESIHGDQLQQTRDTIATLLRSVR